MSCTLSKDDTETTSSVGNIKPQVEYSHLQGKAINNFSVISKSSKKLEQLFPVLVND